MTSSAQYGYKAGLSTIDEIAKIEHAVETGPDSATIVLMDPPKAFDCVNRLSYGQYYTKQAFQYHRSYAPNMATRTRNSDAKIMAYTGPPRLKM